RFRMRGSEDMGNGMKVGAYWELGISSSPSTKATPDADSDRDGGIGIRQANLFFSGNWGKLTLGHGSEAADGTAGADLSGTNLTHSGAGSLDNSADVMFWNSATATGGAASISQDSTYSKYDGGRNDNIRYDSPKLGPVGISASVSNDQRWSAAAKVKTALGGGQLSAGLGYVHATGAGSVDSQWSVSASYLFSQGTNISGYYGTSESEAAGSPDQDSFAFSVGHKWGVHAVEATYSEGEDRTDGYERTGYAVEYVHSLKKVNTQLYAGYLHAELDGPSGSSYDDIDVFTVGARVKFD
ncbi:MAG: putative porin, partial [Gammaproteobacteria bacterium]